MFVVYMWCRANAEGDAAGFTHAADYIADLNGLDYELNTTECLWFVPNTATEE